jgi:hypothetical protein
MFWRATAFPIGMGLLIGSLMSWMLLGAQDRPLPTAVKVLLTIGTILTVGPILYQLFWPWRSR